MANVDPHSPVYDQNTVVTDPKDPKAVQIPDGANDGTNPGPHVLTEPTPNEVASDPEFQADEDAEAEAADAATEVAEANAAADEAEKAKKAAEKRAIDAEASAKEARAQIEAAAAEVKELQTRAEQAEKRAESAEADLAKATKPADKS